MANPNRLTPGEETVPFRLTMVVEREYKRRGVFPSLRFDQARRMTNGGAVGIFELSAALAEELIADVVEQRAQRQLLARGVLVALNGVEDQLRSELKRLSRRGLWDDPGMQIVLGRAKDASALLPVGTAVLYFDDESSSYGREAKIVEGFTVYSVRSEDGPYVDEKGTRREYRPGYVITIKGDTDTFWVPAHRITLEDCKPAHIKLVQCAT